MRLTSLTLSNWACHPRLSVDFSRGLQIEGRNGTGKSSILSGVRFAFAATAAGYKNKIRNGEREAEVELSYAREGKKYLIAKSIHVDKPSTARLSCDGVLVADNPSSVSEALKDFLSEDVLDNLLYVPQGQVTGIVDRLTQKGGRQELDALFGLNRLEKVYRACGEKISDAKSKAEAYSEQLARHPKDAEKEYSEKISSLKTEAEKITAESEAQKKVLAGAQEKLRAAEERIKALKNRKKERDEVSGRLGKVKLNVSELSGRIDALSRDLSELSVKSVQLAEYSKSAEELRKFKAVREALVKLDRVNEQLEGIPSLEEAREKIRALELEASPAKKIPHDLSESEAQYGRLTQALIESELELNKQKSYLTDLSSLSTTPKCPRCGQRLSRGHLLNETMVCEQAIKSLESRIANINAKEPELKKRVDDLKASLEAARKAEYEMSALSKDYAEKTALSEELKKEAALLAERLSSLGYAGENQSLVEEKVAEYNTLKGKMDLLSRELSEERVLREELERLKLDYLTGLKDEEGLEASLASLSFEQRELDDEEAERDGLLQLNYVAEGKLKEFSFRLDENARSAGELEAKRSDFMELKARRDECLGRVNLYSRAREVFHTDKGLAKYLRDKYLHALGASLTSFFKRFNQNPAYKEVFFDQDYRIQVKSSTGLLGLEQLSGGERVQLAVALRIALIEMMSPVKLLILDEPFGSLDVEHRELLGETLNKMAAGWQIILVTHVHVDSLSLETMELEGY